MANSETWPNTRKLRKSSNAPSGHNSCTPAHPPTHRNAIQRNRQSFGLTDDNTDNMSARHRLILPSPSDTKSQSNRMSTAAVVKRPPRTARRNACEACRLKKSACNGTRPRCGSCARRGTECVYKPSAAQTLQNDLQSYADVLSCLMQAPEKEAIKMLHHMRAASNPSAAVASLQGSMHNKVRPSELKTARALSPLVFSDLELEFLARHSAAYPTRTPLNAATIDFGLFSRPLIGWFASCRDVGDCGRHALDHLKSSRGNTETRASPVGFSTAATAATNVSAAGPMRPPALCDSILHNLRIGYWSTVDITDELAGRVISFYLEVNHPLFGFFEPDLFVHDLVSRQPRFCSALLVNAVLAYACKTYSPLSDHVSDLAAAFFDSAEILWRAQRSSDSILTLAALNLLGLYTHVEDARIPVMDLLIDSHSMANRLQLLGVKPSTISAARSHCLTPEWKRATAHVAWGTYAWLSLNSFYCPIEPIHYPPVFPIPGDREEQHGEGGEDMVKDCHHSLPKYMGFTFTSLCKFWLIMQEVTTVYSSRRNHASSPLHPPLAFAESVFQRLLALTDDMAEHISAEHGKPEHAIGFQILFHCGIIDLFHPFSDTEHEAVVLKSFSVKDSTVKNIVRASINQLKRLMLLCRSQYPQTLSTPMTNAASLHLGNAMIRDVRSRDRDPDWRFFFLLCLSLCEDLYKCFSVFYSIFRGLLAMAMRNGVITTSEARFLLAAIDGQVCQHEDGEDGEGKCRGCSSLLPTRAATGEFFIDFDLAVASPHDARASALADSFEDISVFNEFTTDVLKDSREVVE